MKGKVNVYIFPYFQIRHLHALLSLQKNYTCMDSSPLGNGELVVGVRSHKLITFVLSNPQNSRNFRFLIFISAMSKHSF